MRGAGAPVAAESAFASQGPRSMAEAAAAWPAAAPGLSLRALQIAAVQASWREVAQTPLHLPAASPLTGLLLMK